MTIWLWHKRVISHIYHHSLPLPKMSLGDQHFPNNWCRCPLEDFPQSAALVNVLLLLAERCLKKVIIFEIHWNRYLLEDSPQRCFSQLQGWRSNSDALTLERWWRMTVCVDKRFFYVMLTCIKLSFLSQLNQWNWRHLCLINYSIIDWKLNPKSVFDSWWWRHICSEFNFLQKNSLVKFFIKMLRFQILAKNNIKMDFSDSWWWHIRSKFNFLQKLS